MIFVSQNGDGDFTTINEAIENANDNETIIVKAGMYTEKVVIKQNGINLIGEVGTVLTYNDYANKEEQGVKLGTFKSYTLLVLGEGFKCDNFIFENTAGFGENIIQAVAVFVYGDKARFRNCEFHGYQDTLCLGPIPFDCYGDTHEDVIKFEEPVIFRSYFESCYIKGDVDFIFGGGVAVFNKCQIHSLKSGEKAHGYVTASSTHKDLMFGLNFFDCHFTANFTEPAIYLGRPWRPFSKTAFINCIYDNHIKEEGFIEWESRNDDLTYFYGEYNCKHNKDKEKRVSFAKELTEKEVLNYTFENIFNDKFYLED